MKNNKMLLPIIIIVIIILSIAIYLYIDKINTASFSLIGDDTITIDYGQDYIDPGFMAKDGRDNDLKDYVEVSGEVNTREAGPYEITYKLKYKKNDILLRRIVIVNDLNINDLEMILNGDEETYIMVDSLYEEHGAYVLNKIDNINIESDINIDGTVNTSQTGEYEVRYTYIYHGNVVEKIRKVNVFDFKYSLSPSTITSNKVTIGLDLSSVKILKETKLPDGSISTNNNIKYSVDKNGEYVFNIYTTDGKEYEKVINVSNIVGTYICSGTIGITGTQINVSGTKMDQVKGYTWQIDGKKENGTKSIKKEKIVKNATVDIEFDGGEKQTITCSIKDNLVYHFKYDENNTKPFMKCNTYTDADRVRLEANLKKAISQAGYGTRAGVVEAARFIVGALDYKVKYLGPKTVDTRLGRYEKVGLNIGKKDGWGCMVSGWANGIDCTGFVAWAFIQNGIKVNSYATKNTYLISEALNKINVGDLFLSPKTDISKGNFSHVGIVIGIDEKYFYVAESTTGSINALVVTKRAKTNPGGFKYVRLYEYTSNGNLTKMWLS